MRGAASSDRTLRKAAAHEAAWWLRNLEGGSLPDLEQVPPVSCEGPSEVEGHPPSVGRDSAACAEHMVADLHDARAPVFGPLHVVPPFVHQLECKQFQQEDCFILRPPLLGSEFCLTLDWSTLEVAPGTRGRRQWWVKVGLQFAERVYGVASYPVPAQQRPGVERPPGQAGDEPEVAWKQLPLPVDDHQNHAPCAASVLRPV